MQGIEIFAKDDYRLFKQAVDLNSHTVDFITEPINSFEKLTIIE